MAIGQGAASCDWGIRTLGVPGLLQLQPYWLQWSLRLPPTPCRIYENLCHSTPIIGSRKKSQHIVFQDDMDDMFPAFFRCSCFFILFGGYDRVMHAGFKSHLWITSWPQLVMICHDDMSNKPVMTTWPSFAKPDGSVTSDWVQLLPLNCLQSYRWLLDIYGTDRWSMNRGFCRGRPGRQSNLANGNPQFM